MGPDLTPRYTKIPCGCVFGSEPLPDGGQAFVYSPCSLDCQYYLYTQKAAAAQGKPMKVTDLRDLSQSRPVAGSNCPSCGEFLEMALDTSGGGAVPKPGDWSICARCYAALVFGDDLTLRTPTEAEMAAMPPELAVLQRRAMDGSHR